MTSQLAVKAVVMPVGRRCNPSALLHHSGQGSYDTREHFQTLLDAQVVTCSMRLAGEVRDNPAKETLSSPNSGLAVRKVYRTRGPARSDVLDCTEYLYNPTRRHSTLGYLNPVQFERSKGAWVGVNGIGSSPVFAPSHPLANT
jgi:putative transposase